jgi:hypothetical protein
MANQPRLSIPEDIGDYLSYDPNTGHLTNKVYRSGAGKVGDRAGGVSTNENKRSCNRLCFRGKKYANSRVAWFLHHGEQPPANIDHTNRDSTDDRIVNLRAVTHVENCRNRGVISNNTSSINGVSFHSRDKKWTSHIRVDGALVHLGSFYDKEDAIEARRQGQLKYWGTGPTQHIEKGSDDLLEGTK